MFIMHSAQIYYAIPSWWQLERINFTSMLLIIFTSRVHKYI